MKTKVHSLRKAGYKVRVLHYRVHVKDKNKKKVTTFYHLREFEDRKQVWGKGGQTVVQIKTPDGREFEEKVLCSEKDCFNRKLGINMALGRMAKKNNLTFPE